METIEYTDPFDANSPDSKGPPIDAQSARQALEDGNRMFSQWMQNCRTGKTTGTRYVVQSNGLATAMVRKSDSMPKQAPFAVVVGCSDARVPLEMLFGQGFNDLFVVRVAGNVMGDVCMGSIDFALTALIESVKVVVMIGHSGCGAVSAAVDSYLQPSNFRSKTNSHMLRSIQERIFIAVRESDEGLREAWGDSSASSPLYRTALIECAVALNAAQSAYDLRQEVERSGKRSVDVLFGVCNLHNNQVSMPVVPDAPVADENVRLAHAPTHPGDFRALALQMAGVMKSKYYP